MRNALKVLAWRLARRPLVDWHDLRPGQRVTIDCVVVAVTEHGGVSLRPLLNSRGNVDAWIEQP